MLNSGRRLRRNLRCRFDQQDVPSILLLRSPIIFVCHRPISFLGPPPVLLRVSQTHRPDGLDGYYKLAACRANTLYLEAPNERNPCKHTQQRQTSSSGRKCYFATFTYSKLSRGSAVVWNRPYNAARPGGDLRTAN